MNSKTKTKKQKIIIEDDLPISTNIEVIFHLGDIHIPGNPDREEEYETVLNRTVEIIKKETRSKMVVICGDLFHDKTKPYQEANILARKFMKNLGDVCDTVIIQGNHDVNIDNESRKDSIKATLCELETQNKIYYLTENEQYKINDINFILTKMNNQNVTPIKNKLESELYIGLYHGTLYKSSTDEGYEFKDEEKIKASDFKDYDIVMLGDIHKYQFMNKEKTIAYSGSLIQQNFGESINYHGMILWNLKNKSSEFIEVPNDYIYKTHKIEDINNTLISDIEGKKCRLRLIYKNIERLELNNYEKRIKTRYNIVSLTKQEIIEDIVNKKLTEEIINNNFIDVYKDFLTKNKIDEDKNVTELITSLVDNEHKTLSKGIKELKLNELEFGNLFTYGIRNKINFTKLNGINILTGTNGIGKSSLIDVILFTIYNTFSRGSGKDALNIRHDYGYSVLKLELNNEKYTIHRTIIKNRTHVQLFKGHISKNDIDKNTECVKKNNISNDSKKSIDAQIIELFGTYDEMIMTSVILQIGINFIDLKDNDKKKLLTKIFGLDMYENIYVICKGKSRHYDSNVLTNIERQISNINYNEIIINYENDLLKHEKNNKKYNEEYLNVLKEKHIIEYNTKHIFVDIEQIIIEKNKLISEKILLESQIDKIKNQIEKKNLNNIVQFKKDLEMIVENNNDKIKKLLLELIKTKPDTIKSLEEDINIKKNIIKEINSEYIKFNKYLKKIEEENIKI